MTKMDSYESSQGGIKQWKTRKDKSEANKLAERGTSDKATNREIQSPTRLDQWIGTRLDARPV